MRHISLILFVLLLSGCKEKQLSRYVINGLGEGTTYRVVYYDTHESIFMRDIDSIISVFDNSCSIFNPNSQLSKINKNESTRVDKNIEECISIARRLYNVSDGMYDITIKPLVDAWGFSAEKRDSTPNIDSLLQIIGLNKISVENGSITKADPRMSIDLNSIAKGYSVDLVSQYLYDKGIKNHIVEIGGEIRARGCKPNNKAWTGRIDKPFYGNMSPGEHKQEDIELREISLATSGNYRRSYINEKGERVSHTINPKTGLSSQNNLLSVSVFAPTCAEADAYATMFMAVGLDKAKEILSETPDIMVYIVYSKEGKDEVYISESLKKSIIN